MQTAPLAAHLLRHLLPVAALAYTAGAALAGVAAPEIPTLRLLLSAALLTFTLSFLLRQRPSGTITLLPAFALTGLCHTGFALLPPSAPDHLYQLFPEKTKATLSGTVLAMPEYDGTTTRFVLDTSGVLLHKNGPSGGEMQPVRGRIRLSIEAELPPEIHAGTRLLLLATVGRTLSYRTPGVSDYRLHLAERGIYVTGRIASPEAIIPFADRKPPAWHRLRFAAETLRQKLNGFLAASREPQQAALYQALLLGSQAGVDEQTLEHYKATGTMHILSISGVHMSLLGLLLTGAFGWLLKRSTRVLLLTHAPTLAIILSLPPLVGYAAIAGMNTPVLRALLMSVLFLVGVVLQRQRTLLPVIAAAALFILLARPLALFTASFQLSFSAVLALAVVYPRLLRLLFPEQPVTAWSRLLRYVGSGLLVSVAATLGTLPFLLTHFNRVSLLGPVINLLVEPILCFWTLPCGLLAMPLAFAAPGAAGLLLDLGGLGITAADCITALGSTLPLASLWTVTPTPAEVCLYLLLLWSWASRPMTGRSLTCHTVAAILLLGLFCREIWLSPAGTESEISYLDVGQGSSTFIRLPGGETLFIDGGSKGTAPYSSLGERVLAPFLWKKRVWRLDDVVITHPDSDHYNGLPFVLRRFRPRRLWINGADKDAWPYRELLRTAADIGAEIREPGKGEMMKVGDGIRLLFLNGADGGLAGGENERLSGNDRSLVLKLTHGAVSLLFPGDIQHRGENLLLAEGTDLRARVLLAAHHGSRGSSSDAFIEAVAPELIIVSSGARSRGGYLDPVLLAKWRAQGRRILATALDGTVTVRTDGQRLSVETFAVHPSKRETETE